jgi:hypothetical protein
MNKEHVIGEIQRTAKANDGAALGWRRFEEETGIRYYDWYGKFWTRWSDAVREAGLKPNRMSEAFDNEFLLEKLVVLTRKLGHIPTVGDLMLARRHDATYPSKDVFLRLGSRTQRIFGVIAFCEAHPGNDDVACMWRQVTSIEQQPEAEEVSSKAPSVGYVYLLKHGSRREYKIGMTTNPLRREGEVSIQLPDKLRPIHYIKTDDPGGVENYWHRRFSGKRKEVNGSRSRLRTQSVQKVETNLLNYRRQRRVLGPFRINRVTFTRVHAIIAGGYWPPSPPHPSAGSIIADIDPLHVATRASAPYA